MRMSCQIATLSWPSRPRELPASSTLAAQGITTAAVSGVVTDGVGQPVEAAQIQVMNDTTGVRSGAVTRANGNYYVQGSRSADRYVITVRRIGFAPDSATGVRLSLGQNFRANFKLQLAGGAALRR